LVPSDLGDPLLSTAILWWNAHVLPLTERWWNGFAFAPATGTLAFSDHRLGLSLIASPLQWLGLTPLTAYNIVLLLTFPLCAIAAHILAFTLTKRHDAAAICGLAYGFNPFRISHLSHLELLAGFAMPLALAALHMYLRDRRPRWIVAFAVALFVQGLCATYYLLFFAVLLALWMIWFIRPREWRTAAAIGIGGAAAAAALLPIALAYVHIHRYYGFVRTLTEVETFSADLSSLWTASPILRFWGWTMHFNPTPERQTFPGLTVAVVAAIGAVVALRRAERAPERRTTVRVVLLIVSAVFAALALSYDVFGRWRVNVAGMLIQVTDDYKPMSIAFVALIGALGTLPSVTAAWRRRSALAFYLIATAVLVVFSLGPSPAIFGHQFLYKAPYAWLRALPVFGEGIRAPARFMMPAALVLAAASALAFNRLSLTPARRQIFAAVAIAGVIADGWIGHMVLQAPPTLWPAPAAYEFGPVLELPFDAGLSAFLAMYRGTLHGHPVVNGSSGYFPPHFLAMKFAFDDEDATVFDTFATSRPLLVALRTDADPNTTWERIVRKVERAQLIAHDEHWKLYNIPPLLSAACSGSTFPISSAADGSGPVDASALQDGNLATDWRTAGPQRPDDMLVLDLGRPSRVCAVAISVGEAWQNYPRGLEVATSTDGSHWTTPIFNGSTAGLVVRGAIDDPRHIWITVPVHADHDARFVRLRLNARTDVTQWVIAELRVVGP
jgi:F5/8 type C domain